MNSTIAKSRRQGWSSDIEKVFKQFPTFLLFSPFVWKYRNNYLSLQATAMNISNTLSYRPRNAGHDYYSRFHNLNTLATEICSFNGEAKIIR